MAYSLIKKSLIFIVATLIACSALAYFCLFTTPGGIILIKWAIPRFIQAGKVEFEDARGSVLGKFTMRNVRVRGLHGMPRDSVAAIRQMDIRFEKFSANGLRMVISGGSLVLPTSESVFFYGDCIGGIFDFNVYSKRVGIESLIPLLGPQKSSAGIKGSIANIDLLLKGSVKDFILKGTAAGQSIEYKSFSLTDAPFVCDMVFKNNPGNTNAYGNLIVKKGRISGPNKAVVELNESKLAFSGDLSKPRLDINGKSRVEQTEIRIFVSGTSENPDLKLFSEPPLPQEQLLVMLATGKQWSGAEAAFSKGEISPDLAMDFLDYFLLGGSGSKLARKFGITGFSVTFDETKKGVGVKGALSERAEVGYGVVQTQSENDTPEITQKLSGELKVTDTVSVIGEKEFKQAPSAEAPPGGSTANDTIMIQFKKRF